MVTGSIAWETVLRFSAPSKVESMTVIVVAVFGIAINRATALLFMAGRKGDLNVRAAFIHLVGHSILWVLINGIFCLLIKQDTYL